MDRILKMTSKKIVGVIVCLCLLLNTYLPLFKVFAIADQDKPNYVEIRLRRATDVSLNGNTATIEYQDGKVTVSGENLDVENVNWNYGEYEGPMYILYTTSSSLTFNAHPSDGFTTEIWDGGQPRQLENNVYEMDNLLKKSQLQEGYDVEFIFHNEEHHDEEGEHTQPPYNGNKTAHIHLHGGEGSYEKVIRDESGEIIEQFDIAYADDYPVEISINGKSQPFGGQYMNSGVDANNKPYTEFDVGYDEEAGDETIELTLSTMWHLQIFDKVVINGIEYDVKDDFGFDYNNRDQWLTSQNNMHISMTATIPKADNDNYDIAVKIRDDGPRYLAAFLWTADPNQEFELEMESDGEGGMIPKRDEDGNLIYKLDEQGNRIPGKNYIGHSRLEMVKAEYEVNGVTYTVTEDDIREGIDEEGHYDDGFLSYGSDPNLPFDDGGLNLPDGARVTMRVVPDYGYQVVGVNGDGEFTTTDEGVSEFTVTVNAGAAYFLADVQPVDDVVKSSTDKVKSGTIEIGNNEIDSGTVVLSVEDVQLSSDKIKNFKDAADGLTIDSYLDINLDKVLYKGSEDDAWTEQIHKLNDEAVITLKLADGVDVKDVVIVHNIDNGDEFEIIEIDSYDPETNTITFRTKSFSNYAIATRNTKDSSKTKVTPTTITSNPQTKDNIYLYLISLGICILGFGYTTVVLNNRRKYNN